QREAPPHLGGRLRGAGEIALRPRDLARLSAQDREAPLLLGVAYLGPAGDLLRVGGLGHVVGHLRGLGPFGLLRHEQVYMVVVGGEGGVRDALSLLDLELRQRGLLLFFLFLLLFLRRLADVADELPLLLLEEGLAVGE